MGGTDGDHDPEINPYTVPENYTVVAEAYHDNDPSKNGILTFRSSDYLKDLPLSGELKAIVFTINMYNQTLVIAFRLVVIQHHLQLMNQQD